MYVPECNQSLSWLQTPHFDCLIVCSRENPPGIRLQTTNNTLEKQTNFYLEFFSPLKTTGVNFINILHARFCTKVLFSSYVLAKKALSYEKCTCKMLMKLTPVVFKVWQATQQNKTHLVTHICSIKKLL